MSSNVDPVEDVVLRHLEEILLIPRDQISLSDDLIRDLKADGDDLSFLFIPGVQRELGVSVAHHVWRKVFTVQDAVDTLRAATLQQQNSTT